MSLEAHFAFLDDLPEALYQQVVTLHHGTLRQRVEGILAWRHALLRGELPDLQRISWPEPAIAEILVRRLDALDLVPLCEQQEALVDEILKDVCAGVESILRRREQGIHGLFDDVVEDQRRREREHSQLSGGDDAAGPGEAGGGDSTAAPAAGGPAGAGRGEAAPTGEAGGEGPGAGAGSDEVAGPAAGPSVTDGAAMAATQGASDQTPDAAAGAPAPAAGTPTLTAAAAQALGEQLQQRWEGLLAQWRETEQVFRGMGSHLGRGWDLSSGELHSQGWRDFVAYRRLIHDHPQLVALVDSLGREAQTAGEGPRTPQLETQPAPAGETLPTPRLIRMTSPQSTRGITRSDDIARMLPQEAAYLGHPRLKLLWHARRAEQGLLSYQVEGVLSEHRPEPLLRELEERRPRPAAERRRGPLIICLDTSASLHGEPERIAKAVCLEVLRLANQTQRRCLLYAFSGPGQVVEQELRLTPGGLREILRFLALSFHGGTDIRSPMTRALARIREAHWQRADMLLISDGRFPVPPAVERAVARARQEEDLRLVGLVIGRWRSPGLQRLCRPVHRFTPPSDVSPG